MHPALVMTADIITHPHLYDTEKIENWSWDKETKEKANGQASSIRRFENLVSFIVQKDSRTSLRFTTICFNCHNMTLKSVLSHIHVHVKGVLSYKYLARHSVFTCEMEADLANHVKKTC